MTSVTSEQHTTSPLTETVAKEGNPAEKNQVALRNIISFCQELKKLFTEYGYRVVLSGRTAQYLLRPELIAQEKQLVLNDLDFILIGSPEVRDSGTDIVKMLQAMPALRNLSVLTIHEIVTNAVAHGAHAANVIPDSTTVKGTTSINDELVDVEFFLGNEAGFGYQTKEISFNTPRSSFDPFHQAATTPIGQPEKAREVIEVVSSAALLLYYMAINKKHRITELLYSYKDEVPQLFESSAQLNPALQSKFQLAEQYYRLTNSIEKVAQLLGHSEVYVELVLGVAQSIKNIGNMNAGIVIEKLELPITEFAQLLHRLENNPLIEAAFAEVLRCFPSDTKDSEFQRLPKTYEYLEAQLTSELLKLVDTDPAVIKNRLDRVRKRNSKRKKGATRNEGATENEGYIFFLKQMLDSLKRAQNETLSFHGWHHAINTSLVSVALAEKEQLVPESERVEMAIATMIVGLFHDLGITLKRSYVNHELFSSYLLAVFIEKISNDPTFKPLLIDSLLKKIKVGLVALFGTALNFDKGVRIGAELGLDEFKASVKELIDADKIATVPADLQAAVSSEKYLGMVAAVLDESQEGGLLNKWYQILSVSDVSGMLTKTCILGTYELSLEEEKLANRPLGGLRIGSKILESLSRYLEKEEAEQIRTLLDPSVVGHNIEIFARIASSLSRRVAADLASNPSPVPLNEEQQAAQRKKFELQYVNLVRKLYLFHLNLHDLKDEEELLAA